jgi:hypothetical protein
MSAKDKATDLVRRYLLDCLLTISGAKVAALIAVDEVLDYSTAHGLIDLTEYYLEVKQEIEKL